MEIIPGVTANYLECPVIRMDDQDGNLQTSGLNAPDGTLVILPSECLEAINHVKTAAYTEGISLSVAVLEALGMWTLAVEECNGKFYRYLIKDEAFDWILLTDRLIDEIEEAGIGQRRNWSKQVATLVENSSSAQLRRYLGIAKYRAYLNYHYGVTVEFALQKIVRIDIKKRRVSRGHLGNRGIIDQAFDWIYGEFRHVLVQRFLEETQSWQHGRFDNKSFTYWLADLRLRRAEPVRFASDTRSALEWLERNNPYLYAAV